MSTVGELVAALRTDGGAMARFRRDPELFLDEAGWSGLAPELVEVALTGAAELNPPLPRWAPVDLVPGVEVPSSLDPAPVVLSSVMPPEDRPLAEFLPPDDLDAAAGDDLEAWSDTTIVGVDSHDTVDAYEVADDDHMTDDEGLGDSDVDDDSW